MAEMADLSYWRAVRRSDLIRLRCAVRKGTISRPTLDAIMAILREVRARPETKPYLVRSLDLFFADVGLFGAPVL